MYIDKSRYEPPADWAEGDWIIDDDCDRCDRPHPVFVYGVCGMLYMCIGIGIGYLIWS